MLPNSELNKQHQYALNGASNGSRNGSIKFVVSPVCHLFPREQTAAVRSRPANRSSPLLSAPGPRIVTLPNHDLPNPGDSWLPAGTGTDTGTDQVPWRNLKPPARLVCNPREAADSFAVPHTSRSAGQAPSSHTPQTSSLPPIQFQSGMFQSFLVGGGGGGGGGGGDQTNAGGAAANGVEVNTVSERGSDERASERAR